MDNLKELATGLAFPEGPIAMPDGSVLLVEIKRGSLTRVCADGTVEIVAQIGGGPNGAAIGPDGRCYLCNNGGFEWHDRNGLLLPGDQPADYSGGRIEAVDLDTGEVEVIYTHCDDKPLRGPNDLVFDAHGKTWVVDEVQHRYMKQITQVEMAGQLVAPVSGECAGNPVATIASVA